MIWWSSSRKPRRLTATAMSAAFRTEKKCGMKSNAAISAHRAFGLNDRWVPLYNIHKTYAGLRDAWLFAGNEDAKQMLIALTDWMIDITKDLSDSQIQDMLRSEHGGLNETFADVAVITGDNKYMELARRFSDHSILDPLTQQHDELTGKHANTPDPQSDWLQAYRRSRQR